MIGPTLVTVMGLWDFAATPVFGEGDVMDFEAV